MITETYITTFQIKRGTQEALDRINPILGAGEPCIALDTGIFKVGNGKDHWKNLITTNAEVSSGEIITNPEGQVPGIYLVLTLNNGTKHYIPFSNAQLVGKATENGGEIFNDYETNNAYTPYSVAFGTGNTAGCKGYQIKITDDNYLPVVDKDGTSCLQIELIGNCGDGYAIDDIVQIDAASHYYDDYKIVEIDNTGDNSVIYVSRVDTTLSTTALKLSTTQEDNWLWVAEKSIGSPISVQLGAAVFGTESIAAGNGAFAAGKQNRSVGDYSATVGRSNKAAYSAFAAGRGNEASGFYSFAACNGNKALGSYSVAFGEKNTANGMYSFVAGSSNTANGSRSFIFGSSNTTGADATGAAVFGSKSQANGACSFAVGDQSIANGRDSVVFGYKSTANGSYSFAVGNEAIANGNWSIALNKATTGTDASGAVAINSSTANGASSFAQGTSMANGTNSVAMGNNTNATGNNSFTGGADTAANGYCSVALGQNTVATGQAAAAFGYGTTSEGLASFSSGINTVATGQAAAAFGQNCNANYRMSFAFGNNISTKAPYQAVFGKFAKMTDTMLFGIGDGTGNTDDDYADEYRNAFSVYNDGHAELRTQGETENSVVIISKLNSVIGDIETALDNIITIQESLIGGAKA